jgi:hypothetical protein
VAINIFQGVVLATFFGFKPQPYLQKKEGVSGEFIPLTLNLADHSITQIRRQ